MGMRLKELSRYQRMLKMLERSIGATVPVMMEELGISRATVYRYLGRLEEDGFALTTDVPLKSEGNATLSPLPSPGKRKEPPSGSRDTN